jgi:hypothetical protein
MDFDTEFYVLYSSQGRLVKGRAKPIKPSVVVDWLDSLIVPGGLLL